MLFNEKTNSIATRQIDIWYETSTHINKLWSYSNYQKFSRNVDVVIQYDVDNFIEIDFFLRFVSHTWFHVHKIHNILCIEKNIFLFI